MKYQAGDRLEFKKKHPCGNSIFVVKKTGVDMTLECENCLHKLTIPRVKIEKIVKKIVKK